MEYGSAEFVIIWVFGWAILALIAWYVRGQRRERMIDRIHKERMMALEKGVPLPEIPEYHELNGTFWGSVRLNPKWPLGVGAVFIMAGIGTTAAMILATGKTGEYDGVWQFCLVPIFVGVGLWLHYWLTRR
jgi:hypothetical protein